MSNLRRAFTCVILAAAFALYSSVQAQGIAGDRGALGALEATQAGFRQVHNMIAPAVVSITSQVQVSTAQPQNNFPFNFFNVPRQAETRVASGSGVIIRPNGIILTNSHVVQGAKKVIVQLMGSDQKLPAEVVQSDQRTDMAIVRIEKPGTYPYATLGDANTVHVGDWAIAFGSPFELASTMTVGVISATGRKLPNPDEDFNFRDLLQTDASINPGNSGGPLVNIHGEVIGINFMIYSPGSSTGSVGIGFAIPINHYTRPIIDTLASGHTVAHGQLGVRISNLDDTMRHTYGVEQGGVLVQNVVPGLAADKAGIKAEDIIIEYNGTKITDNDQLSNLIDLTQPGEKVNVIIMRHKKLQTILLTVGSAPTKTAAATTSDNEEKLGASLMTMTSEVAQHYGLPDVPGVVITKVVPGGPADAAGLGPGDIIVRIGFGDDATAIKSVDDFWQALGKRSTAEKSGLLLRIRHGDEEYTCTLPPFEQ